MSIYRQLGKFDELFEAHGINMIWLTGNIYVKNLPDKYKEILLQFGYNENALVFGINDTNPSNNKPYNIARISYGKHSTDWTNLLYKDVDRNWYYALNEDDYRKNKDKGADQFKKDIDEQIYKPLQRLFMFMDVYIKQREQLNKLVKIEYDNVTSSIED